MSQDVKRATGLVDLIATAVIGAVAEIVAELRASVAQLRLELDKLRARAPQRGEPGPPGEPGPAGPQGPPGRDAHYIRPVPWRAGTHARATVVEHAGGIWEALAATATEPGTALSAWTLILDAPEPDRVDSDPDGFLVIVYKRASGTEKRLRFWRPHIYAGVWDSDTDYLHNDLVTHDGSTWLAVSASKGERPGAVTVAGGRTRAPAWRLIVKRGRAGRNAAELEVRP